MTEADRLGEQGGKLRAPDGTYSRLRALGNMIIGSFPIRFYDPSHILDWEKVVEVARNSPLKIEQEEVCDVGGSCVDLSGYYLEGEEEMRFYHIHLTRKDEIETFDEWRFDVGETKISVRSIDSTDDLTRIFETIDRMTNEI